MNQNPLILLHWEAFYPFSEIQEGLMQSAKTKTVPIDRLRIALPLSYLQQASSSLEGSGMVLGAGDMLNAAPKAFTRTVAANALQEAKASFVLLGKAFDRNSNPEFNTAIKFKIQNALENKTPIFFCFGEKAEESDNGKTAEVIQLQLKNAFEGIDANQLADVTFIYDTPHTLSDLSEIQPEIRDQVYSTCLQQYTALWGEEIAAKIKTLCALSPYLPISPSFFTDSPFAGIYFKMIESDLSWLGKSLPGII